MSYSRRKFLKTVGFFSLSNIIGNSLLKPAFANTSEKIQDGEWLLTGSHWGAFRGFVQFGELKQIKPFERDPHPSYNMLDGVIGSLYSPTRVRYPMVRLDWLRNRKKSGLTRGSNRFVRVTWDQALDLFYEELEDKQKIYGPSSLFTTLSGSWSQTGRFHSCNNHMARALHMHGNYVQAAGDYSTGAGQVILPYVIGSTEVYAQGTSWPEILDNSDNIVLWANDLVKNLQIGYNCETHESFPYLDQLKKKIRDGKISVISVDPVKNKTQRFLNNDYQYINPQSDVAFMLAVAHVLYTEGLYDKDFIDTYCIGFDTFIQYVLGNTKDKVIKSPEWAAQICGISPNQIKAFAHKISTGRTQFLFGWAIQRQQHGEQPYWMGVILASMLGQIGLPGGGISFGHHYSGIGIPGTGLNGPAGFPRGVDKGFAPKWVNSDYKGASSTIPVTRWADSVLEPGKIIDYNGHKIVLPDIKMLVICGNNPWNHHQDRNKMKKAFQKLETVVTIDFTWSASCRYADIVLPACTQWERNDLDLYGSYAARGILGMRKLVDPLYQSKSDFEIFMLLAKRFNREKEYCRNMDEMQWIEYLYNECKESNKSRVSMPTFDHFWKDGYLDFGKGKSFVRHAEFRADPEINPLGTPSGFIELTSHTIGNFGYDDCQEHPMWFEKIERTHGGPNSNKYPIWLQSCHPDDRLHSQLCDSTKLRNSYSINEREPLYMNPKDAKKLGIIAGDIVRVYNARGQVLAGAVLDDHYPEGVARLQEGAWYGPVDESIGALCTYGDPNTLTPDIGASKLSQGTSAFTCSVAIEKYRGKFEPVRSFSGPNEIFI